MRTKNQKLEFIPGLELAEALYKEAVAPILEKHMPDLKYSAALIGSGSEVLGFDDNMSTDHHWGPRLMLFLDQAVLDARHDEIKNLLGKKLPFTIKGYSTAWTAPNIEDKGTQHMSQSVIRPVNHRIEIFSIKGYFKEYVGINIDEPLRVEDWLTIPFQKLRSITAGRLFRDDLSLGKIRDRFSCYPHDAWLYIMASCWSRIGEEEHLTGRTGFAGDEIGSAVIASRLVRDIMRLAFIMEKVYPPYPKWLGKAFANLSCAPKLRPVLNDILKVSHWKERDPHLAKAYKQLAEMHNSLQITPNLPTEPSPFWGRPFTVIHGERFADAIRDVIQDPQVKAIASRRLIGNIDLISDNTDLLEDPTRRRALFTLYK